MQKNCQMTKSNQKNPKEHNRRSAPNGSKSNSKRSTEGPQTYEEIIRELNESLATWNSGNILNRHKSGEIIRHALSDPDKYGSNIISDLAEKTGYQKTWLYDAKQVADTWSRNELQKLITKNKTALSWSSLALIAKRTDNKKERDQWITKILESQMSVQELKSQLNDAGCNGEGDSQDLPNWLRSVSAFSKRTLGKCQAWRKEWAQNADYNDLADKEIRRVKKALKDAEEARDGIQEVIDDLSGVLKSESESESKEDAA